MKAARLSPHELKDFDGLWDPPMLAKANVYRRCATGARLITRPHEAVEQALNQVAWLNPGCLGWLVVGKQKDISSSQDCRS